VIRTFRRVLRDPSGAAIIEFGILAPVIVTLLLGVVQVGMWMQSYNGLRSVAADTGRYVAVKYQKSQNISNIEMANWAHSHAVDSYLFKNDLLTTDVTDAPTQQITGVSEKTLTLTYTFSSILQIVGVDDIPVSFSRPIFVKAT
jgi:Flp pilus assembly protein TadG